MAECDSEGVKKYSDHSYIFSKGEDPNPPRIYSPENRLDEPSLGRRRWARWLQWRREQGHTGERRAAANCRSCCWTRVGRRLPAHLSSGQVSSLNVHLLCSWPDELRTSSRRTLYWRRRNAYAAAEILEVAVAYCRTSSPYLRPCMLYNIVSCCAL